MALLVMMICGAAGAAERLDLHGTVQDTDGAPIVGATVYIYEAGVRVGTSMLCPSCYVDCGKKVKTDETGAFTITSLDPELLFKVLAVAKDHLPDLRTKIAPEAGPLEYRLQRIPAD